jgi:hypothetical protein
MNSLHPNGHGGAIRISWLTRWEGRVSPLGWTIGLIIVLGREINQLLSCCCPPLKPNGYCYCAGRDEFCTVSSWHEVVVGLFWYLCPLPLKEHRHGCNCLTRSKQKIFSWEPFLAIFPASTLNFTGLRQQNQEKRAGAWNPRWDSNQSMVNRAHMENRSEHFTIACTASTAGWPVQSLDMCSLLIGGHAFHWEILKWAIDSFGSYKWNVGGDPAEEAWGVVLEYSPHSMDPSEVFREYMHFFRLNSGCSLVDHDSRHKAVWLTAGLWINHF